MKPKSKKKNEMTVPISVWSTFVKDRRPILEEEFPQASSMEIIRKLHDIWDNLTDEQMSSYRQKAENKRRTYVRLTKVRKGSDESLDGAPRKKRVTPYAVFLQRKHVQLKENCPDMSLSERTKTIADMWRAMSRDEKVSYVNQSKRETRKMQKRSFEEEESEESSPTSSDTDNLYKG